MSRQGRTRLEDTYRSLWLLHKQYDAALRPICALPHGTLLAPVFVLEVANRVRPVFLPPLSVDMVGCRLQAQFARKSWTFALDSLGALALFVRGWTLKLTSGARDGSPKVSLGLFYPSSSKSQELELIDAPL